MTQRDDDLMQEGAAAPEPKSHDAEVRTRQHSRALVMALLLGGFVVLIFAISIVKIAAGQG